MLNFDDIWTPKILGASIIALSLCSLPYNTAQAIVGPTAVADCGSTLFSPGTLPVSGCTYPTVATTMIDYDSTAFAQLCTSTLIGVDDNKAVFLSAGHCVISALDGNDNVLPNVFMTFEPQPSIPFSSEDIGPLVDTPIRPIDLTVNLLPVAAAIQNPGWIPNLPVPGQNDGIDPDIGVYFVDLTGVDLSSPPFSYLTLVVPVPIPSQVNYLETIRQPLNDAEFVGVGYNRLMPIGFCDPTSIPHNENCPADLGNKSPNGLKARIPAQHNRTFGTLRFVTVTHQNIKMQGKVEQQFPTACNGDSGGPLFLTDPITGEVLQIGIASGAPSRVSGTCTNGQSLYARTDSPSNFAFIQCAIDPDSTVDQAMDCIRTLLGTISTPDNSIPRED